MCGLKLVELFEIVQGCRQLFRTGWGGGLKTKEVQFGSRGKVPGGDMPPPARSAEAKIFLKIQEV